MSERVDAYGCLFGLFVVIVGLAIVAMLGLVIGVWRIALA
jgi:hypothetical protein